MLNRELRFRNYILLNLYEKEHEIALRHLVAYLGEGNFRFDGIALYFNLVDTDYELQNLLGEFNFLDKTYINL